MVHNKKTILLAALFFVGLIIGGVFVVSAETVEINDCNSVGSPSSKLMIWKEEVFGACESCKYEGNAFYDDLTVDDNNYECRGVRAANLAGCNKNYFNDNSKNACVSCVKSGHIYFTSAPNSCPADLWNPIDNCDDLAGTDFADKAVDCNKCGAANFGYIDGEFKCEGVSAWTSSGGGVSGSIGDCKQLCGDSRYNDWDTVDECNQCEGRGMFAPGKGCITTGGIFAIEGEPVPDWTYCGREAGIAPPPRATTGGFGGSVTIVADSKCADLPAKYQSDCKGCYSGDTFGIKGTYVKDSSGLFKCDFNIGGAGAAGGAGKKRGGGTFKFESKLDDPLNVKTLAELAKKITKFTLLFIASPLVVAAVIYAGFLYMTSGGNPDQLKKAKQALIYAITGAIMIALAFGVGEVVRKFYGGDG